VGTVIPLSDASRRPGHFPFVTMFIILVNVLVFFRELMGGDAFVLQWAAIPAEIVHGHHWIMILTAMFLHGSWLHLVGNMVFLWAFGPEIEDAMNPLRYLVFYLLGGLVAMLAQVLTSPHSTVPSLGAEPLPR
jgi:membrane associated rhomboid family serine protease